MESITRCEKEDYRGNGSMEVGTDSDSGNQYGADNRMQLIEEEKELQKLKEEMNATPA